MYISAFAFCSRANPGPLTKPVTVVIMTEVGLGQVPVEALWGLIESSPPASETGAMMSPSSQARKSRLGEVP